MIIHNGRLIIISLVSLLLAACGGGTGGVGTGDIIVQEAADEEEAVMVSGTFEDSPVGNIDYACSPSGLSGVTDASGTWECEEVDTVSFSIGGLDLGSASAEDGIQLTPADLAGDRGNASNPRAIRIARLLQSLDDDGDTSNGTTITDATKAAMAGLTQTQRDNIAAAMLSGNDYDTTVGDIIDTLTAGNASPRVKGDLVSAVDAENELNGTIAGNGGGGGATESSIVAATTAVCPIGTPATAKKTVLGQSFPVCILTSATPVLTITDDVTLTNDHIYVLTNSVNVGDGDLEGNTSGGQNNAVLTIEPGTQIMAANGAQTVLVITRGSRINAVGTPDLPIIMGAVSVTGSGASTVISDDVDDLTGRGQWGGLVLSGRGENNKCTGSDGSGSEVATEAAPDGVTRFFGCSNNADNSGTVKYLIIAESGLEFREDEEVQGLTLEAVGSNTKIDFLQVLGSEDDCIEWFGGAVSITNVVCQGQEDDGFDFDEGVKATVQKGMVITGATKGDEGLEADNAGPGDDATPKSEVYFVNVTLIGDEGSQDPSGVNFKVGFGGQLWRSAIVDKSNSAGWDDCMDLDDQVDGFTGFFDVAVKCANGDQGARGWGIRNDGDGFENAIADGGNDENGAISDDRRDFTVFAGSLSATNYSVDPGVAPNNPGTLPSPIRGVAIGNYFGAVDPTAGAGNDNPNDNGPGNGAFYDGWTYRHSSVEGNLPGSDFHPLAAEITAGAQ